VAEAAHAVTAEAGGLSAVQDQLRGEPSHIHLVGIA
jgi:hypothetical protein